MHGHEGLWTLQIYKYQGVHIICIGHYKVLCALNDEVGGHVYDWIDILRQTQMQLLC